MESVDYCEGTIMYHSSGGGTGSGLGGLIAEKLMDEYHKKDRMTVALFSSPDEGVSAMEPYNTIATVDWMLDMCDSNIIFDN